MQEQLSAAKRVSKARSVLLLEQPFFGTLIIQMPMVETRKVKTMSTDGTKIWYNPDFVQSLSDPELKTVFAHEVLHPALCHHTRRSHRNPKIWNQAADYADNLILKLSGFLMPKCALCDDIYKDMSAEEIYGHIYQPDGDDPSQPQNQPGQGSGQGGGQGGSQQDQDDQDGQDQGKGDSDEDGEGDAAEVNDPSGDPGGMGSVIDAPGGEHAQAQVEADMRVKVQQAAMAAKMAGKLPGHLARLVDEILNPLLPWREVLRRFMAQTAKNNYSWNPPNRRFIHKGMYLPSCRSEEMDPIVVCMDTSGSIGNDLLQEFATEVTSICEETPISTVEVLYVDSEVYPGAVYTRDDLPIKLDPKGGGGTDFTKAFEHIDAQGQTPACVIYLTDGYGPAPDVEPSYPVLWVLLDKSCPHPSTWGEYLLLKE